MISLTKRLLIVQPLPGIGDMIWHEPFIQAIAKHEPAAHITLLTKSCGVATELMTLGLRVDAVLELNRKNTHRGVLGFFRLVSMIRQGRFDAIWILHPSLRYAFAAYMAGVPTRWGYGLGLQALGLNRGVFIQRQDCPKHPIDRAERFLALNQIPIQRSIPKLTVPAEITTQVKADYAACPRPWLALGIGCSDPTRQWGRENFSALLAQQINGTCFLVGGAQDKAMAQALLDANAVGGERNRLVEIINQPLRRVAGVLAASDGFVGNDTGMLNLAAACGTPSIGVFGHRLSQRLADPARNIHAVYPAEGNTQGLTEDARGVSAICVEQVVAKLNEIAPVWMSES